SASPAPLTFFATPHAPRSERRQPPRSERNAFHRKQLRSLGGDAARALKFFQATRPRNPAARRMNHERPAFRARPGRFVPVRFRVFSSVEGREMIKKAIIGGSAVVLLTGLVVGRDAFSYVRTAVTSVREGVRDSIPLA